MGWILVALGGVSIVLSLAINPAASWHATQAWKYRNPEAAEPSDAAYLGQRLGGIVAGIVLIMVGFAVNTATSGNALGRSNSRPAAEKVIQLLGTTTFGSVELAMNADPHPPLKDFQADLRDYISSYASQVSLHDYPAAQLSISDDHAQGATHLFTLAAARGKRYCLRVDETGPGIPQVVASIKGVPPMVSGYRVPITATLTDGACTAK
ncbi:DUF6199 family natural product biosynthesis protein [Nocardia sp. NPDC059240]|uniref:DUF6199 family natural product biosynthesis protein n=1 Tax=Nocardia sp. NPDC059240 TaxID=3346786 RepID=UPI0036829254